MIEEINRIMNHPDIYPYVAFGSGYPLDFSQFIKNGGLAFCDDGVCVLADKKGSSYEAHLAVLPESRGGKALIICKKILDELFLKYNASAVFSRIPCTNKPAIMFARLLGMKFKMVSIEKIYGIDCACHILLTERY